MNKIKSFHSYISENLSDAQMDNNLSTIQSKIDKTESIVSKIQSELFELTVTNTDRILDFKINILKKDLTNLQTSLISLKSEFKNMENKRGKIIPGFED